MDVFAQVVRDHGPVLLGLAAAAGHELGVFGALQQPKTVAELAEALDLPPRRLQALIDALVLSGALVRADVEPQVRYGVGQPPPYEEPPRHGWGRLAEVVRTDRALTETLQDSQALQAFHAHLWQAAQAPAAALSARWAKQALPDRPHLLDLGCGSGAYADAWLRQFPFGTVTAVDSPEVLELTAQSLDIHGGRVTLLAGDATLLDLAPVHDVVLLCHVLHLHGEPMCRRLLQRAVAALAPGGIVVVKDLDLHADRLGPATGVLFALDMALYTSEGTVHVPATIAGWMAEAGLAVDGVERLPGDGCLVVGQNLGITEKWTATSMEPRP